MAKKAASAAKKTESGTTGAAAAGTGALGGTSRGGGGGGPRGGGGRRGAGRMRSTAYTPGAGKDRHLVIVESPAKAKTINKYLGKDYLVLASVGHVRDLPSSDKELKESKEGEKAEAAAMAAGSGAVAVEAEPPVMMGKKKGAKGKSPAAVKVKKARSPVPGVDLEHDFKPTYIVMPDKKNVITDLKRAAKESLSTGREVWFATDLDREGEAIAWHLAQVLGIDSKSAKRVIFPAITKGEIEKAFKNPHPIDEDRVNAQQARRIVDRIVGYQVSPLLWKKVARGLSAGRVQSVAVRLIVQREREIRAFVPEEYWALDACFTAEIAKAAAMAGEWAKFKSSTGQSAKGSTAGGTGVAAGTAANGVVATGAGGRVRDDGPTVKEQSAKLAEMGGFRAELVEVGGEKFDLRAGGEAAIKDLTSRMTAIARAAGLMELTSSVKEDPRGKGPARFVRTLTGRVDAATPYEIVGIETRRTTTRAAPPFITSTLQQAASTRLGFAAQRTMRTAQQLYEGVEIPGEGPVGLITYMRTDSTHLSGDALNMARAYIGKQFGEKYLPEKPNFFTSSNKAAQEAHEAIRPTSLEYPPSKVRAALNPDQLRLYTLIWERFVACQMVPAEWDSTAVTIKGGNAAALKALGADSVTFRGTGRVLVFDGHYRVSGVPTSAEEQTLPGLREKQKVAAFVLEPEQKFTSPPPRFTEASLIKVLEAEGIGRPSTYASIISVIQDRKYVELAERRFAATDLGEVVTDKLVEAFPEIMDIGYTREMESQLDKIEEDHLDWVDMLRKFYGPFKKSLTEAEETLTHAKAETVPAPKEYRCATCDADLVYRFGKSGRFLSCSRYPECKWASPCDKEGRPRPQAEGVDVACPKCGSAMNKRVGRFGPFLGCPKYGDKTNPCDGILNLDKKGRVEAPSVKPLTTDVPCPVCQSALYLRNGARGPWLSCSRFPKCRGRGKWPELADAKRAELEKMLEAHLKANPIPIIKTMGGAALTDANGKPLAEAPPVEQLGKEVVEEGAAAGWE
jgi:DNA topoisomerase I